MPTNVEINYREDDKTFIKVPNTRFWVVGEKTGNLWDIHLVDPDSEKRAVLQKEATTTAFVIFCNVILKSPFPMGKKEATLRKTKSFINKLTKKKYAQRNRSR